MTPKASPDDPKKAVVGVQIQPGYDFPFDVSVRLGDDIGGPSAGLIFSLGVYDTLTPGSLTGGTDIAGTGTINAKGTRWTHWRDPAEDRGGRGRGSQDLPRASGQLRLRPESRRHEGRHHAREGSDHEQRRQVAEDLRP